MIKMSNTEFDQAMCKKYPTMLAARDLPMTETCMCWGFECGAGWFNILDRLMGNIQHHIDWTEKQRNWAIEHNEMVTQAQAGNLELFEKSTEGIVDQVYKNKHLAETVANGARPVPDSVPQVTLDQVKEKFGTLRFYYTGGDDVIDGMVRMAESISGVTCEECGAPGKQAGNGWIRTVCEQHTK